MNLQKGVGFVLCIASSYALTCPKVICGSSSRSACVDWINNNTEVVIQPCSTKGQLCENINLNAPRQQYCTEFNGYTYDFWNPFYGVVNDVDNYDWRKEGEVCNDSSVCDIDYYCSEKGVCVERASKGDQCKQGICKPGLVCIDYECVEVGSLDVGERSANRWACRDYWMDTNGVCAKAPKSRKHLPIECSSDNDCFADDGTTGRCECGMSVHGKAYCSLHYGDRPYQEYYDAYAHMNLPEMRWKYFEVAHYPQLQNTPDCLTDVLPSSYLFQVYRDAADQASLLVVGGIAVALLAW